ncbi:MAG: hypothetical protein CL397_01515 [Acidiferrobacteraceae bacterium]|nr:hypothetical protein [Acidiferrobacteraceae bacterium]
MLQSLPTKYWRFDCAGDVPYHEHTDWSVWTILEFTLHKTVNSIMNAASALFLQRNYADVTMAEIAGQSGVSKGAVYHHFSSKEDLYLAMMRADLSEKQQLFAQAVETTAPCRDRLALLTRSFFSLSGDKRRLAGLIRRDINALSDAARSELIGRYQAALPNQIQAIIDDGIQSGELNGRDPRLLAWSFIAIVETLLSRYGDEVLNEVEAKLDFVVDLFMNGAAVQLQETPIP